MFDVNSFLKIIFKIIFLSLYLGLEAITFKSSKLIVLLLNPILHESPTSINFLFFTPAKSAAIWYVVIVAVNLFALVKTTRIRFNLFSVFAKPIICGILCGVAAYTSFGLCNRFIPEFGLKNIMALGISIGFGGVIYVISMLFIKGISKDDVVMLPKGEKIAKILAKYGFIE